MPWSAALRALRVVALWCLFSPPLLAISESRPSYRSDYQKIGELLGTLGQQLAQAEPCKLFLLVLGAGRGGPAPRALDAGPRQQQLLAFARRLAATEKVVVVQVDPSGFDLPAPEGPAPDDPGRLQLHWLQARFPLAPEHEGAANVDQARALIDSAAGLLRTAVEKKCRVAVVNAVGRANYSAYRALQGAGAALIDLVDRADTVRICRSAFSYAGPEGRLSCAELVEKPLSEVTLGDL